MNRETPMKETIVDTLYIFASIVGLNSVLFLSAMMDDLSQGRKILALFVMTIWAIVWFIITLKIYGPKEK